MTTRNERAGRPRWRAAWAGVVLLGLAGCGGGSGGEAGAVAAAPPATAAPATVPTGSPAPAAAAPAAPGQAPTPTPTPTPTPATPAFVNGYAGSSCGAPAGLPADVSRPARVVGNGTPGSCTSEAVVAAVAQGGVVTFDCGAAPVTITMNQTARVFNDKPDLVLDGGGKVTLSGGGRLRILYQNTCDPNLVWTSARCDLQANPSTTVQNIAFVDADSTGQTYGRDDVYGGGAIYVRGGGFSAYNTRFLRNRCENTGPDLGGGALRLFGVAAARVASSTFGGSTADANVCSNGGAISGLQSSITLTDSLISDNRAVGFGANPQRAGTPGGGSGGAIYQDGNTYRLEACGSRLASNEAVEGGSAIFFVSNDSTGSMSLRRSLIEANSATRFETAGYPGIFVLTAPGNIAVADTVITR